jgi:SAM-dependent methyltransferase
MGRYYPPNYVSYQSGGGSERAAYRLFRRLVHLPYVLRYGTEDLIAGLEPGRVLDLGCGAGENLETLSKRGWDVFGVEPSPAVAARVVERLHVSDDRIVVAAAEQASFAPSTFDLVVMSHVLEHLHEPRDVLRHVHDWLAPGGRLLIRVPNASSLESRIFGRFWFGLDVPRHLAHFTPETLARLLVETGFTVDRLRPQFQASSLSGSLSHVRDALLRRRSPYRHSKHLYLAALPVASVLLAFGQGGCMEVLASKAETC